MIGTRRVSRLVVLGITLSLSNAIASAGWIEATAIVRSLDRHEAFFVDVGGYEVRYTGETSPAILRYWGLGEQVTGREMLLAEPESARGFIRLVALAGAGHQREIRSAGQFFDSGGIMGLNVRVSSISKTFERAQASGWRPLSDPVWFSVEDFSVGEAIFLGPDGLSIGLIERKKPPLGPEWVLTDGTFSRPNNAFVITADLPSSRAFYLGELSWKPFLEDTGPAAQPGMNLYGWPHNRVEDVERHVVWWHPDEGGEGSLAQIQLRGATGRDFSQSTAPPNLGWVALRHFSDDDSTETAPGPFFILEPYGCVRLRHRVDPDGVRHEFLLRSSGCPDVR
ncbi:MAG: hypothetical protein AAGB27_04385 [Pseudomonadota bacterium]